MYAIQWFSVIHGIRQCRNVFITPEINRPLPVFSQALLALGTASLRSVLTDVPIPGSMDTDSSSTRPSAPGFFRSAGCFQGPAVRRRVSGLHSLSGPSNPPWCGEPAFRSPVRPVVDAWVVCALAAMGDAAVTIRPWRVPGTGDAPIWLERWRRGLT